MSYFYAILLLLSPVAMLFFSGWLYRKQLQEQQETAEYWAKLSQRKYVDSQHELALLQRRGL